MPATVAAGASRAFIADVFAAAGFPAADAARIAELMTEADLTGADAHGIFRLPHYIRRFKAGAVNARPSITVNQTAPATALVDGDNGMGHLVMSRAAETAIAPARENGIAWVGATHSNHASTAGIYAEMPVHHGMIGLYGAVANPNHMAGWGGTAPPLGTNPLGIGVPSGSGPLVLDMATTVVSYGTVKKYALEGRSMPEGWMVNTTTGAPLTDARRSTEGMLLPIGGYKGAGLAMMLGLLAGVLNGAAFGKDVVDFNADDTSETNTGHFICAIDIKRFIPLEAFNAEVDRHMSDFHASPRLPGFDATRLPGERRRQCRDERLRDGIPLPDALAAQLDKLAGEMGVKAI